MITAVYAVRRKFFRRLAEVAAGGGPWAGIQVAYSWPGENAAGAECVYGGQGRFEHSGDKDLIDGDQRFIEEELYFWVHVQVTLSPAPLPPDDAAEVADRRVEEILTLIGMTIAGDPHMMGDRTELMVRDGQADYMPTRDNSGIVSNCSVQIGLTGFIDPSRTGS